MYQPAHSVNIFLKVGTPNNNSCKKCGMCKFQAVETSKDTSCKGPCLPKCCDGNKILQRNANAKRGFDCVDSNSNLSLDITLTDGKMKRKIDNSEAEIKFYSGVFPACEGLGSDWKYQEHHQFSVNATLEEKYILLLKDSKVNDRFV